MDNKPRLDEVDLINLSMTAWRQLREAGYDVPLVTVEAEIHNLYWHGDGRGDDKLIADQLYAIVFVRPGVAHVFVRAGTLRHD